MQTSGLLITTVFGLLLTGCASVHTEPTPEARAALAPTGKLRIGLFTGNPLSVIRSPGSQEMKGVAFDFGEELARRIQVQFEPVVYPSFAAMYNDAKSGNWDVSVFVASPDRMKTLTSPVLWLRLIWAIWRGRDRPYQHSLMWTGPESESQWRRRAPLM
jgi:polar amino acid transport system substrate-binding protein